MRYLVTGGAGFIGSHLVDALIACGNEVVVFDDLSAGKHENINAKAQFMAGSITDQDALQAACKECEGIFHMAALANVQQSIEDPITTHTVNDTGSLNVVIAAHHAKVRRIVFSSSSAVYGEQQQLPFTESMLPAPISPYGAQKLSSEHYMRLARTVWGIESVSLRYANVFGPRLAMQGAYRTVIAIFLEQQCANSSLTVTGDGTQTRDFVYVDDVVAANIQAMESQNVGAGEVINIGTGESQSVLSIAQTIGGAVTFVPPRIEPHDTRLDISLAKQLLHWQPITSFAEGLEKTISWYKTT